MQLRANRMHPKETVPYTHLDVYKRQAVSSLIALKEGLPSGSGPACALIDARNGNAYAAAFDGNACTMEPSAVTVAELLPTLPPRTVFVEMCIRDSPMQCFAFFSFSDMVFLAMRSQSCNISLAYPQACQCNFPTPPARSKGLFQYFPASRAQAFCFRPLGQE